MLTRHLTTRFALALTLTSLVCTIAAVPRARAAVSFEGERIVWIVPSREGGGSDSLTRAVARFFTKHLPGNPTIVIRNIPGHGQVQGTNHFFENAKPDGLMVITSSTSSIMNQALGNKAVKYDLAKARTVVAIPQGTFVYANVKTTGVTDMGDIKTLIASGKSYRYGGYGPTSTELRMLISWELLGVKITPLWGMGRSKTRQAFMRGETDLNHDTAAGYLRGVVPLVRKKSATLLFTLGVQREDGTFVRDPVAPDVPHFNELYEKVHGKKATGPEFDAWLTLFSIGVMTSKTINLPPGTPDDVFNAYLTAAKNIFSDPEFAKVREKQVGKYEVFFGAAGDKMLTTAVTLKPDARKWLANFLKTRYDVDLDTAKIGG